MGRPALEVADIFRDHGPAWRDANRGSCEPRPAQGDGRDRALPHGGARRARLALRERRLGQFAALYYIPIFGPCRSWSVGVGAAGGAGAKDWTCAFLIFVCLATCLTAPARLKLLLGVDEVGFVTPWSFSKEEDSIP